MLRAVRQEQQSNLLLIGLQTTLLAHQSATNGFVIAAANYSVWSSQLPDDCDCAVASLVAAIADAATAAVAAVAAIETAAPGLAADWVAPVRVV